jgi:hypothetical protein
MSIAFSPFSCYNGGATKSAYAPMRGHFTCPQAGHRCLLFVAENNVPAREGASHWVEPEGAIK